MRTHAKGAPGLRTCAWGVALALIAFLCVWPLAAGMVAVDDDLKFVRGDKLASSVADGLRAAWNTVGAFRPLEIIVGAACDKDTLACAPVFPVQFAGLLAVCAGVVLLARRLAPAHPVVAPLALAWLALSPSTMVSLWQMDTCSQTWSAAFGVWAGLLAWRGFDAAQAGRVDWRAWLALLAVCAVAVNVKEMFYGWSAGIGCALMVAIAWLWRRDRAAARRAALLLVPVVALPILHMAIRMKFGGLGQAGGPEDRYAIHLGGNLLLNSAASLAGVFANGPLHLVRDESAAPFLRLLAPISVAAVFCLVAAATGLRILHSDEESPVRVRPLILCAGAAVLSLTVTLPMGSISELYGFGANVGSALLVACALVVLCNPPSPGERAVCQGIAWLCAAALLLVGGYGVASRAYHFDLTWQYARRLNEIIVAHQRSLGTGNTPADSVIYMNKDCFFGWRHNTYVETPICAVGYADTEQWLNRTYPMRKVLVSLELPVEARPGIDLVVDCADFPKRVHW